MPDRRESDRHSRLPVKKRLQRALAVGMAGVIMGLTGCSDVDNGNVPKAVSPVVLEVDKDKFWQSVNSDVRATVVAADNDPEIVEDAGVPESIIKSTVKIRFVRYTEDDEGKNPAQDGTGFIFNVEKEGQMYTVIATARHVIEGWEEGKGTELQIYKVGQTEKDECYSLTGFGTALSGKADFGIIVIGPGADNSRGFIPKVILTEEAIDFSPIIDTNTKFSGVGFPGSEKGEIGVQPIVDKRIFIGRDGVPIRLESGGVLLLNSITQPGTSGAPMETGRRVVALLTGILGHDPKREQIDPGLGRTVVALTYVEIGKDEFNSLINLAIDLFNIQNP